MLFDLTQSNVVIEPTRFPAAIVVLVSDAVADCGKVTLNTGTYWNPSRTEIVPLLVTSQNEQSKQRTYRAYALTPKTVGDFTITSFMYAVHDSPKREVRLQIYLPDAVHHRKWILEVLRNDPNKEKANYRLAMPCDYDASKVPPYITWATLGRV